MALKDLFQFNLGGKIAAVFHSSKKKEEIFELIEEELITADVSLEVVERLMKSIRKKAGLGSGWHDYRDWLTEELLTLFASVDHPLSFENGKEVLVLVGVNGSGKTTSVAKLSQFFRKRGRAVLMSAADTFRAAGSSQLQLWGEKLSIPVIGGERGSDAGAVVYNSLQSFANRDFNMLLIDTAGRVQTKEHLMKELEKTVKIIKKSLPAQPREVWLVLDATTGQNSLTQAERFMEFSGLTGLFLTKLDGTAKGGTVLSVIDRLKLPVRFLGTGEGADDLMEFNARDFVAALVGP